MKKIISICILLGITITTPVWAKENRCGWLVNPSPANWWLYDKEGEWLIGMQGGYQAKGTLKDSEKAEHITQNGSYGTYCACLQVDSDRQKKKILRIFKMRYLPLTTCRRDKNIKHLTQ